MEPLENILDSELQVDEEVSGYLGHIATWAKYVAILGFIYASVTLIKQAFNMVRMITIAGFRYFDGFFGIFNLFIPFIAAAVYFAISIFTYRFAVRMKYALVSSDQQHFDTAWHNFKMAYRIIGIVFIFYVGIILLVFLFFGAMLT